MGQVLMVTLPRNFSLVLQFTDKLFCFWDCRQLIWCLVCSWSLSSIRQLRSHNAFAGTFCGKWKCGVNILDKIPVSPLWVFKFKILNREPSVNLDIICCMDWNITRLTSQCRFWAFRVAILIWSSPCHLRGPQFNFQADLFLYRRYWVICNVM
jgi:hypothetical protein